MAFIPTFPLSASSAHGTKLFLQRGTSVENTAPRAPEPTRRRAARMVTDAAKAEAETRAFSPAGMTVDDFFERSMGEWRSQRSSHNLAWTQFEQITSEITIEPVDMGAEAVTELCAANSIEVKDVSLAVRMAWEGESDWDDDETSQGETVMAVVKDSPTSGRLLRSIGYAETIPAVGEWSMNPDGVFVLVTPYEAAAAEERIWFATPNLRMRVSQIRTSSGTGVVTASLSTEIRRLNLS